MPVYRTLPSALATVVSTLPLDTRYVVFTAVGVYCTLPPERFRVAPLATTSCPCEYSDTVPAMVERWATVRWISPT